MEIRFTAFAIHGLATTLSQDKTPFSQFEKDAQKGMILFPRGSLGISTQIETS